MILIAVIGWFGDYVAMEMEILSKLSYFPKTIILFQSCL